MCERCVELSQQEIPQQYFSKNGSIKPSTPVLYKKINFIRRAIAVHGNKFCYKHIENINSTDKLPILCAKHGIFLKVQGDHTKLSQGCPKCTSESEGIVYNTISFIEKAKLVHRETYDYYLVEYTSAKQKVKILCKIHGIFEQAPYSHLNGNGCPKCGIEKTANSGRDTLESFISKARLVHRNKYEYTDSIYINSHTKIKFKCNCCGDVVEQAPKNHLNGYDACNCYIDRDLTNNLLYIMFDRYNDLYKIGISSSVNRRLQNINRSGDLDMSIIYTSPIIKSRSTALKLEKYFHKHFKNQQYTELFETDIDGKTELFNLEPEDIEYIKQYISKEIQ